MTSPHDGNSYQQDQGAPGHPGGPKITSILRDFTAESLEELAFWLEQRGLHIPVTQLIGFSQFTANIGTSIVTQETTTSTASWADLATTGPTVAGLSDGRYLAMWGCQAFGSAIDLGVNMGVSANGATPNIDDACQSNSTSAESIMSFAAFTLSAGGNNTLTAKYKMGNPGTGTYRRRRLLVLRYGN